MRCIGAQRAGRGLSVCPVGPLLHLQGKAELWAGGGWGLGRSRLEFLSLGGIQGLWRKWPPPSGQAFFFFSCTGAGHTGFFPEAPFPHTAPPGWPGMGKTPPHTHSRGGQALGFLSLSGQAYWRKTVLKPSSKQETALPASWRTGTVPMATVGQRGHINPSQARPGLELLLPKVTGCSTHRCLRVSQQPFSRLTAILRARLDCEFIPIGRH